MNFNYSYSAQPEKIFHLTSNEGHSFFIKKDHPLTFGDFPDDQIDQWGQLMCALFESLCTSYGDDISYITYQAYLHLAYDYKCSCIIWSDDAKVLERQRIGKRIREIREEKKLDLRKVASLSGITEYNLERIEEGRYSVKFDILAKIALALGTKLDFIPYDK
jgi:DNA-binding Xre family transcriptional regulator